METLFKVVNEQKMDITLLREHALLLKRKIYQVQLKVAEELYKIKQDETTL